MEVCWNYSLKYTKIADIKAIDWSHFFSGTAGIMALVPAICYVGFGVGNVIFFSKALNVIPASTAFAIWMGLALVGIKIVDTLVLKEAFTNQTAVWQDQFEKIQLVLPDIQTGV